MTDIDVRAGSQRYCPVQVGLNRLGMSFADAQLPAP
jgi:hypothetical protein